MPKRILVIGGGVIGLNVAYACQRRGMQVCLIERESLSNSVGSPLDGCSMGNAGMVVPSHFIPLAAPGMVAMGLKWMWNPESPFYIKPRLDWDLLKWGWSFWRSATAQHVAKSAPVLRDLHLASRQLYVELAENGLAFGLAQKGLLMLCKLNKTLHEEGELASQANQWGVPAQVLDRQQLSELDPNISMDVVGGVYYPKDCHLQPDLFCAQIRSQLIQAGAELMDATHFQGWRMVGNRIVAVQTNQGELTSDEFVVCGGCWSDQLVRSLGLNIPIQAGKGYALTLPSPVQLPKICSILVEARVAVTPMGRGLRFGGTMEISGINHQVSDRRVQGIVRSVPDYFPKFGEQDFVDASIWHGLRPCSPDGLPYVGRTEQYENLCIATGHAMMGLSLAPITGHLLAQILDRQIPSIDLKALSPDRFSNRRKTNK